MPDKLSFNASPTSDLSYLIGVRFGDGFVFKHPTGKVFCLRAKSKKWVEYVNEILCKIINRSERYPIYKTMVKEKNPLFSFYSYYQPIAKFLDQSFEKFFKIIDKYPKEFIRGFFHSEGSVYPFQKFLRIKIGNTEIKYLEKIQNLLLQFGIESKIYSYWPSSSWSKKLYHCLNIQKISSAKKFMNIIGDKFG